MLVVLIAGTLGSGKTTLLLPLAMKLREEGRQVGILENDAGKIPVDAPFLQARGFAVEDIRSGCICCDLSTVLPGAIKSIRDAVNPEILLLEPSGLATPGILRNALQGLLEPTDCIASIYLMDMLRYAGNGYQISPFFARSMETSDMVLATKTAIADANILHRFRDEVRKKLPELHVENSDVSGGWSFESLCKLAGSPGEIRNEHWRTDDTSVVERFSAAYRLIWKSETKPPDSMNGLIGAVSEIRNRIGLEEDCSIGTVKISTAIGGGTIISVSDAESPPSVNNIISWKTAPENIVLNVLVYGRCRNLASMIRTIFNRIDGLKGTEKR